MNLHDLGWNEYFAKQAVNYISNGYDFGRIALEHKHIYRIYSQYGELLGEVAGKLRFQANAREDYPAVGDWVAIKVNEEEKKAIIHAVLPRFSKFSRKSAGELITEQIIATNIDIAFLVNALNEDFNLRRLERYLTLTWESGANPVIILNKADLCDDIDERISQVESIALGVPIVVTSSLYQQGIERIYQYITQGKTAVLLGSSGVGKSTLSNALIGENVQRVSEIREADGKGKHTTTHRELLVLPNGGLLIDTPGMRELQLWVVNEGLSETFEDIEHLAEACYFTDCKHIDEPNCAVKTAIAEGSLNQKRYNNYLKLQRELAYISRKENKQEQAAAKDKWKKIHKEARARTKYKRKEY